MEELFDFLCWCLLTTNFAESVDVLSKTAGTLTEKGTIKTDSGQTDTSSRKTLLVPNSFPRQCWREHGDRGRKDQIRKHRVSFPETCQLFLQHVCAPSTEGMQDLKALQLMLMLTALSVKPKNINRRAKKWISFGSKSFFKIPTQLDRGLELDWVPL